MAINIKGSAKAPKSSDTDLTNLGGTAQEPPKEEQNETPNANAGTSQQAAPGHQTGAAFLMSGGAQKSQVDQVKAMQDLRSKLNTVAREFWLNPGEFAKFYFLDGNLLSEGVFDTPMISTHFLQMGGKWARFVCNQHTEGGCIVCNSNVDGSQPQTHQLFTGINVMPYTIQNGPRKGQVLQARLQLFAATLKVREKLIKRAQNHGNTLAGSIYQFSRSSKQDPRTGDDIEFVQEVPMQGVLQKYPMLSTRKNDKGEWEDAPTTVYDYAKVYPVLTNAELSILRPDLGGGYVPGAMTGMTGPASGFGSDPTQDIDDEIPF